jgi:hypothetical protein
MPSEDYINCWPLYITDNDEVMCRDDDCDNRNFFSYGRRKTFGELKQDLIDHILSEHKYATVDGKAE